MRLLGPRYYLGDLLGMVGITDASVKQKFNLANSCWSLVVAFTVAMLVRVFRRRVMYLACTISLLCCYIAWTISMERAVTAKESGSQNEGAAIATIFFIFAYSPCYNIGYNALTYSARSSHPLYNTAPGKLAADTNAPITSLPRRTLAVYRTISRHLSLPAIRQTGRFLHHLRQPHRSPERFMEVPHQLLLLAFI